MEPYTTDLDLVKLDRYLVQLLKQMTWQSKLLEEILFQLENE